ncbi:MAG: 16S rRNA (guanine(966)-N(2))-methyltransferase RsmD [Dissulfuribacterales bacterium]
MRVISGAAKGRRLTAPRGLQIRPTTDFVKEAMFQLIENRLGDDWEGRVVLDLFAGTGALGIEALSRGATLCLFVDNSQESFHLLQKNLKVCGLAQRSRTYNLELFRHKKCEKITKYYAPFQLILADPPYATGCSIATIHFVAKHDIMAPNGILVMEEREKVDLPLQEWPLSCFDRRSYGDTALWFYERIEEKTMKRLKET